MREEYEISKGLHNVMDQFFSKKRYSTLPLMRRITTNDNLLDELISLTPYLPEGVSNQCRLYNLRNGGPIEHMCKECGIECPFLNFKNGYRSFCTQTCSNRYAWKNMTDEKVKDRTVRIKKTHMKKYGVEWCSKHSDYREKVRKTSMERFGVPNPNQSKEVKARAAKTMMDRHGGSGLGSPTLSKKIRASNMAKYGVEFPWQRADVFDKIIKKRLKHKDYTMPSGKIVRIQGYEDFALDELLKTYIEDDLVIGLANIRKRTGILRKESDDRVYFPDIYITSINKIVEVKSRYTYFNFLEENLDKKKACTDAGFDFEFMVYERDGTRVTI